MEYLDIVDENGNPTGDTIERVVAHREGIRHRTAHVWLLRKNENGETEILLQKRSSSKDSNPGCYDISSAGHIPAGNEYVESALRECQEELGIVLDSKQLNLCFHKRVYYEKMFHGEMFKDNQVSAVFTCWLRSDQMLFSLQKEEVEEVKWMNYEEAVAGVRDHLFPNCIDLEEIVRILDTPSDNSTVQFLEMTNRNE